MRRCGLVVGGERDEEVDEFVSLFFRFVVSRLCSIILLNQRLLQWTFSHSSHPHRRARR